MQKPIILKPKSIMHNRLASVGYVVIEMKPLIISEYSKLAQKEYETIHDWVGKVIHKELCKKMKFVHTTESYIH